MVILKKNKKKQQLTVNQHNTLELSCPPFSFPPTLFPPDHLSETIKNDWLPEEEDCQSSFNISPSISPLQHPDLVTYPSYQYPPFSAPSSLYFSYDPVISLYPVTITTTMFWQICWHCSERWSLRGREWERAWERETERATHPPKNLAPITVHYVPRSCEMLDFQYNIAILSWLIHSCRVADCYCE